MSVIWHDLECGSYMEDLEVWRELAAAHGGPVLDVGAGTGRVTLDLARTGVSVTALDVDGELLAELRRRAGGLEVTTVVADARTFTLDVQFPLCIVPMQTIQLMGGAEGRMAFLRTAGRHLARGGRMAIALADELELFDAADGPGGPLADVTERDGVVYSSRAVAVRRDDDGAREGFVLERVRETVTPRGELTAEPNLIHLDLLEPETLEREGVACGLHPAERIDIPPTDEYVGSTVVVLDA